MSDEATDAAGFGLIYFNARWMDPWLGRFAQADAIIPGAGNPQAWDRYAFVNNNPVRYTDPSGHKACLDVTDNGVCIDTRKYIQSKYNVKFQGGWDDKELSILSRALDALATYAGGAANLNATFLEGMRANGSSTDELIFRNGGAGTKCSGGSACWKYWADTIFLSDDVFTNDYQRWHSKSLLSGSHRTLIYAIQLTMIHEMGHVFADAHPDAVDDYGKSVDNPLAFYSTRCGNALQCLEENMVSSYALFAVTGGEPNSTYQEQLDFVLRTQYYWRAQP